MLFPKPIPEQEKAYEGIRKQNQESDILGHTSVGHGKHGIQRSITGTPYPKRRKSEPEINSSLNNCI